MDRKRLTSFTVVFGLLIILVIYMFARSGFRTVGRIQLPQEDDGNQGSDMDGADTTGLDLVAVTPETVQQVIASMERPDAYSRSITVETIWNGGSGTSEFTVAQKGNYIRIDEKLTDGSIRHLLTDGDEVSIWYDNEGAWTTLSSGDFSGDQQQRIPTYEDILQFPAEDIKAAEYGEYGGVYCIAVSTEERDGYMDGYWISVDTGLLVAAETYYEGNMVYRMSSLTVDTTSPDDDLFCLPDGTSIMK